MLRSKIRRFKFWLHLISAYLERYTKIAAAVILLLAGATFIFVKLLPQIIRANVVTIGYVGNYSIENIPTSVLTLVTDSLVRVDDTGRPQSALSSHWTISDDGKTYVVFLKDNLTWHDGSAVDARNITIAIENVKVTGLNNKAIEFKLASPISSFPTILDKPVFKTKTFYGVGEYRMTDIDSRNGIIKKISLAADKKGLPRVDIRFYQTENQLQEAIKIGEVKFASVANAATLARWPNLEVEKQTDRLELITIFFNTQDSLLSSREFRQALAYAINRSGFDGEIATSPLSKSNWAYSGNTKKYEYNTGRAKELLSKSQVLNPRIVLSVTGGYLELAESIANDWHDLGVDVEIKEEKEIPQDFQALLALSILPRDPDQYALWHSTQIKSNLTKLKNVKVDKLLEDGRTLQKEEDRKPLYGEFQQALMEDLPAIFLYHPYKYKMVYKNSKDLIRNLPL